MRRPSGLGGRRRLALVGFFLFIELNVVLLSVLAVSFATTAVQRNAQDGARRTAGATTVTLDTRVGAVYAALEMAAKLPEFARAAHPPPRRALDLDLVQSRLTGLVTSGLGFDRAFVTDLDGVVVAYQPTTSLVGVSLAREQWYRDAQGKTKTSIGAVGAPAGAYFGTIQDGSQSLPIVTPLFEAGSRSSVAGYLVGILDLGQIQSFVDELSKTTGVAVTVIDAQDLFVARPASRIQFAAPIDFELVHRALAGHSNLVESPNGGSPLFSSYSALPNLSWVLVTDIPATAALAEVRGLESTVLVIGLVLSCVLMAGMAVGMRQLQRLQESTMVRRQAEAMRRLNEAAYGVHNEPAAAVLDRITQTARFLTEADFAALVVYSQGSSADLESMTHSAALDLRPESFPALAALLFSRFGRQQSIRLVDVASLYPAGAEADYPPVGPLLAAPLAIGDDVLGILVAARRPDRGSFDVIGEGLLTELSHHAVTAIQKARHAEDLSADLEAERERFRIAFEEAPIGMLILDTKLTMLRVNEAFTQMLGYSPAQLAGSPLDACIGIEDWDAGAVAQRLLGGETPSEQAEHRCHHSDGHWVWALINVSLVRDSTGAPLWFLVQLQDVTERRHLMEMRIEGALRESEAKSRFLATMSHELRTPLNAIMGFAQLIGRPAFGDLNDRQRRYLHHIDSSSRHLLALIGEVLDHSKIQAGAIAVTPESVELQPLLEELVARARPEAESKGLVIELEVKKALQVWADPLRLSQILTNLISNAIKFTPSPGWIVISAAGLGGAVRISICDTGIGVPADQRERIFEEFIQVDAGRARLQPGTGLGLSISRRLAELMEGSVAIEANQGPGTTFIVTLPQVRPLRLAALAARS